MKLRGGDVVLEEVAFVTPAQGRGQGGEQEEVSPCTLLSLPSAWRWGGMCSHPLVVDLKV